MLAMSTGVQPSKLKNEKNSANISMEVLVKLNAIILQWKRNSCGHKENRKVLNLFSPKPFLIRTDYKGILGFVKKNLSNMQAQGQLLRWQLWLNQFSFSIKYIQGSKNSLADSLTHELANGSITCDRQSRTPAEKEGNSK